MLEKQLDSNMIPMQEKISPLSKEKSKWRGLSI